jgi:hypothetical protein
MSHRHFRRASTTDDGSSLILVLVFMIVIGLLVIPLLTYSATVFKANTAVKNKVDEVESVKAAMRYAIAQQREAPAQLCSIATPGLSPVWVKNVTVRVSCTYAATEVTSSGARKGVVITQNAASAIQWTSASSKVLQGPGLVGDTVPAGTLPFFPDGYSTFSSSSWTADPNVTIPVIPAPSALWGTSTPPVAYARPSTAAFTLDLVNRNRCSVFFPGWYKQPLTLDGVTNDYFFVSGVYFFEQPLIIKDRARVVAGRPSGSGGTSNGCIPEAEAYAADRVPNWPMSSGSGATFLFGAAGRLEVRDQGVLRMNERVPSTETAGTRALNIYQLTAPIGTAPYQLPTSSLTPTSPIVTLDGLTELTVPGLIYAPNAQFNATASGTKAKVSVRGGLTIGTLNLNYAQYMPTTFILGLPPGSVVQRTYLFHADSQGPSKVTSDAVVQINSNGDYAINSWRVG